MSETEKTGRAGVSVSPADLASIGAATARSRVGYWVEVSRCSESGRPLVHVEADRAGLEVHFLPTNDSTAWGALDHEGTELATGPTIHAIVQENGGRLFV